MKRTTSGKTKGKAKTVNVELPQELAARWAAYQERCPEIYKGTLSQIAAEALDTELDSRIDSSEEEYYEQIGRKYALKKKPLPLAIRKSMEAWFKDGKLRGRICMKSLDKFYENMPKVDALYHEQDKSYIRLRKEDYDKLFELAEHAITLAEKQAAQLDAAGA